ncbi:MAG: 3'-phosphoadenosine 5'-phosphosulfate sulfotransferase [Euryarchaeota archaeon]|nr:3'-phosphoadenosine 5'-phosphosulfate sulfotransferase [Euryarchaeota archaeon]
MAQLRLGRMTLHWCARCGVPLIEKVPCGLCGGPPAPVALTPPGDARPAFPFDVGMVRSIAEERFGPGAGSVLLPDGEIVLLNRIPDLDRTDEVIAGGEVLANLTWVLGKGFVLQLRMAGAGRVWEGAAGSGRTGELRSWVVADRGAVPSILDGSNLLGPGVTDCAPGIAPGDEVLVVEETGSGRALLGTGMARMSSESMAALSRGNAVKVRWVRQKDAPPTGAPATVARTWEDALRANEKALGGLVSRAADFIREGVSRLQKPVAVSYSGGKDSLATLLLVLDAGLRPKVLFVDTGLEFPETVGNARSTAALFGLELLSEEAGEAFWENLPRFGPPGRDARWCCKCCKLGPVTRLIAREFPDGVLSFIGQRRYESEARASKGPVWKNPWVPGQTGASPIQDWSSLQVWLYIFSKKVPHNPWYGRGLDRIGCYLCPATNLADLELVRRAFPGYGRWQERLRELPSPWRDYGLWRWRWLPRGVREHLAQRGIEPGEAPRYPPRLSLEAKEPAPDGGGVLAEGRFSRALDLERLAGRLRALGKTALEGDRLSVGEWAEVGRDGSVRVRGADGAQARQRVELLREAVLRSEECAGCGVCTGRCREGAARVERGRMVIDPDRCTQCGACLTGPCPVATYSPEAQEDVG